jgi:hypothetical protein
MSLKEGDIRNFYFAEGTHIIQEIIEPINVKMNWIWDTGICPHCKERITKTTIHTLSKIEILLNINKDISIANLNDLLILGHSLDNRILLVDKSNYKEILQQSKKFNHLLKEII